jgi:hypothetical protein
MDMKLTLGTVGILSLGLYYVYITVLVDLFSKVETALQVIK